MNDVQASGEFMLHLLARFFRFVAEVAVRELHALVFQNRFFAGVAADEFLLRIDFSSQKIGIPCQGLGTEVTRYEDLTHAIKLGRGFGFDQRRIMGKGSGAGRLKGELRGIRGGDVVLHDTSKGKN